MRKLFRSNKDKMISGVCGGIAEYFNVDSTMVRVGWLIATFGLKAPGILGYIICSLVIPEDHGYIYQEDERKTYENTPIFLGGALVLIGAFMLAQMIFPWFNFRLRQVLDFWPILLIVLGVYIIVNQAHNKQ